MTNIRQRLSIAAAATATEHQPESSYIPQLASYRSPVMNQNHTQAWTTFSYASFAAAATMTAIGIWALPAEIWVKGYMAMATVFLIGSCFTLAKTLRDDHESKRLANRIEDAKAEKLLMEIDRR
jgi:hypothetical protein